MTTYHSDPSTNDRIARLFAGMDAVEDVWADAYEAGDEDMIARANASMARIESRIQKALNI